MFKNYLLFDNNFKVWLTKVNNIYKMQENNYF